jgi:hypothetical protein
LYFTILYELVQTTNKYGFHRKIGKNLIRFLKENKDNRLIVKDSYKRLVWIDGEALSVRGFTKDWYNRRKSGAG